MCLLRLLHCYSNDDELERDKQLIYVSSLCLQELHAVCVRASERVDISDTWDDGNDSVLLFWFCR